MSVVSRALTVALLTAAGCSSRPAAPPAGAGPVLPWGAVDLKEVPPALPELQRDGEGRPVYAVLALTGQGSRGAFGAGVLCGWTAAGTRPRFQVVTGVSTGALMATFAFLGPEHDEDLRALYTEISTRGFVRRLGLISSLSQGGVYGPGPLRRLLEQYLDESVLAAVATEHAAGRRLYIGSTNLDTNELIVWDMGAIASSDRPDRLERFHDAIVASMSVPVTFPPVYIEVEGEQRTYGQMHFDGAMKAPILLRGFMVQAEQSIEQAGLSPTDVRVEIYAIVNGILLGDPAFDRPVNPTTRDISEATLLALYVRARDLSLYRGYVLARRAGYDFNVAAIPGDFEPMPLPFVFDRQKLQKLFDFGYEAAAAGYPWLKHPPGLGPYERF
ncbi:MAG: patatin-like phospholipase family protein [Planctomycetota bacterium]